MGLLGLVLLLAASQCVATSDVLRYCHGDPSFCDNKKDGFVLLQVQLLHRHGDRTPVHALPGFLENVSWNCSDSVVEDIEENDSLKLRKVFMNGRQALKGTCMLGQLTKRGESQLKTLGKNFRELYIEKLKLMPPKLNQDLMMLRSTDVDRTVRSAYHFISGMYPNCAEAVEIDIVEKAMDNAFPNKQFCPYFDKAMKELKKTANFTSFYKTHLLPLEAKYSDLWRFPVDLTVVDDTLRARYCHKLDLPPLMTKLDSETIMRGVSTMENMIQDSFFIQQLSVGSFFGDWLSNMELEPKPKFVLYSNHDSTLRAILSAFQIFDDRWPAYASHIAMELWEELGTGKHYVAVQYDGKIRRLKAPCKDYFCYFGDFVKLLNSFRTELCDEPTGSLNLKVSDELGPRLEIDSNQ